MLTSGYGPLVGRDEELASLRRFLRSTADEPGAAVLEGEAGIGKTTLWKAALEEATRLGYQVLSCRPAGSELDLAFAGLADLLADVKPDVLGTLPPPQRRALRVALLVEEPGADPPDQRAVATACLSLLRTIARAGPVLVAIDDVQWLDAASTSVLDFAVRRLRDERVGLLLAGRLERGGGLLPELEGGLTADRVLRLSIGPLSLGAIHSLVQARFGTLTRPLLRKLCTISGGNPFYALEIARGLQRHGSWQSATGQVELHLSGNLEQLVSERLAVLPPQVRELLNLVAAMSNPSRAMLERVHGPSSEALVDMAVAAEVLEREGDRIRFAHPLLAHGVYWSNTSAQRRRIHGRLANAVDDGEERARHLALAAEGASTALAAQLDEAAASARRRGALVTAAELLDQAISVTPADDDHDRWRRMIQGARNRLEAGQLAEARVIFESVRQSAPAGRLRADALIDLAQIAAQETQIGRALAFADEARAEAAGETRLLAIAGEVSARLRSFVRRDLVRAHEEARTAAALALSIGDRDVAASALATQGWLEGLMGLPDARSTVDAAVARGGGYRRVIVDPVYTSYYLSHITDDFAAARRELGVLIDRATVHGEGAALSLLAVHSGLLAWLSGDIPASRRHAAEGRELAELAGQTTNWAAALAVMALSDAVTGDAEAARTKGREVLKVWRDETTFFAAAADGARALALLELAQGDAEAAHAHLAEFVGQARSEGFGEPGAMRFVPDDVEALILIGRLDEAEDVLAWYDGLARRLDRASARAACARCRGLLAAARHDLPAALDHFEVALAQHARTSLPLEQARTQLARGATLRRTGHRRAARDVLIDVQSSLERLGALPWAEQARAEVRRIGGRAKGVDALTPTEERIASLVAGGRSNREVAQVLFLSPRTVEANLSRIYGKLGIRSRSQLARRYALLSGLPAGTAGAGKVP